MASFGLHITGLRQASRELRRVAERLHDAVPEALKVEGQVEVAEAKRRTPVNTHALKDTVRLEGPDDNLRMRIVAGGQEARGVDVDYAVYVHEDLDAHHEQGEAKFIESVVNESAPHMSQRLVKRIKTIAGV